jgi:hypothetical protein
MNTITRAISPAMCWHWREEYGWRWRFVQKALTSVPTATWGQLRPPKLIWAVWEYWS